MRSAQLLRNDHTIRLLRPFWDTSWSQKFGRSSLTKKKQEDSDPYEGNYNFSECDQFTKVTVIGAAGRVGKTLSLLLKTCPFIDHLCLFDTDKSIKGVGVDVSHIDTRCCVSYVCGMRNIQQALNAPDVVIIAAGCPVSPNLSGKKLFEKNAPIVAGLSEACARFCPKACVVLITSPINSLLPVMGEVYQIITNKMPSKKMFGLTTLDVVRANTFVAEVVRKDPNSIIVPVIGGTSQETLVPVISQMKPCCQIKRGEMMALTECLKRAEVNLTDCQNCGTRGASTLSTAYAGFRFTTSLVMALKGAEDIIECAFVKSEIIPELEYLASPLKLGIRGIEYNFGYPPLSDHELAGFEQSAAVLISDIRMGKAFVSSIDDTIRKGLIWKRLSGEIGKTFEEEMKYCPQKESTKSQEEKTEWNDSNQFVLKRRQMGRVTGKAKEVELPTTTLNQEIYSEGARNWTSQSSLNRFFGTGEVQGNCSEITTDSISANLDSDSCREDQTLPKSEVVTAIPLMVYLNSGKHLEKLFEEKQPNGDIQNTVRELKASQQSSCYLKPGLLQTSCINVHLSRKFHTMWKEKPMYGEKSFKRNVKTDEYKRYLMEDRLKMLVPVKQVRLPVDPDTKQKIKNNISLKGIHRNFKLPTNQYKTLNAAAKQKFRNFNMQKKFTPSASALLLLDQKKREVASKNSGIFMSAQGNKYDPFDEKRKLEYNKKSEEEEEEEEDGEKDEERKNLSRDESNQQLAVRAEKDEITKYKDFIFQQLRQLKKENEELKKRLMQLSLDKDKSLENVIQVQSKNIELEKTKLKACWLIMSSTMDAFSNFCKKFTTKSDDQLLEAAKGSEKKRQKEQEDEANEEDKYEDALETQEKPEVKKQFRYDDKYFKFLEKLMEDQMENRMEKEKKRSHMKK